MARLVPPEENRFQQTWIRAREQGIGRQVLSDSLGIDRGRLNDLILGRSRPSLGEMTALTGRRRATLAAYRDDAGQKHSFYTGRGQSLEQLIATGALVEIAGEMSSINNYDEFAMFVGLTNRYPNFPQNIRIYSTGRTLRHQTGGMKKYH